MKRPALIFCMVAAVAAVLAWGYLTVPQGNASSGPLDAILVLGTPSDLDGSLTRPQQWRVDEAVREFRAGQAPRILFSGGPAANRFVEADTMAAYAVHLDVPASAILEERTSHTTLENVRRSTHLLQQHGWHSVEVVSSPEHLHRTAVMLAETELLWRVHPAPTPGRSIIQTTGAYAEEIFGTTVFRLAGPRAEPALHALATAQHRLFWAFRRLGEIARSRLRASRAGIAGFAPFFPQQLHQNRGSRLDPWPPSSRTSISTPTIRFLMGPATSISSPNI